MPQPRRQRRKRPDFDQPDLLPIEVRRQVNELNALKRVMAHYAELVSDLPSFEPLRRNITDLEGNLEDILDLIRQYLDEHIDLDSYEYEMAHLTADELSESLDSYPLDMSSPKGKASAREIELRDDVDALMENMWTDIRDHGYRLHTALIRA